MKIHLLKKLICACFSASILTAGIFAVVSCNQGPIFYTISTETLPQPPLVSGAPTNMVIFEREIDSVGIPIIYVASGRLHWYAKDQSTASWNIDGYAIPQPDGKIIDIAVTQNYLYALCLNGHGLDTTLWRIGSSDNKWEEIKNIGGKEYPLIQSIYADPDTDSLFAGAGKDDKDKATYAILYLDNDLTNNSLKMLKNETTVLSGVAFRDGVYFLSTRGAGIFQVTETQLTAGTGTNQIADGSEIDDTYKSKSKDRIFMGIIKLEDDTVIAIERDGGALYEVKEGQFQRLKYSIRNGEVMKTDGYATGAMALWESKDKTVKMLIIGKQGGLRNTTTSSYTHGYVEFELDPVTGSINKSKFRRDPSNRDLESVIDQDRYRATMGKHPINYLFQAPEIIDKNVTFFASTQTAGLWSYKDRPNDGGWQWNAEN